METLIAAGLLAALAALFIPVGLHTLSVFDHEGIGACVDQKTNACQQAVFVFSSKIVHLDTLIGWLNLLPGLIGVLLAAPILLELESGTYQLSWTQSVTRPRWLVTKLGYAVGTGVLAALALMLLVTWYRTPFDRLYGHFDGSAFDFEGTVLLGYVVFALGLALAIGVLLRRAVPALVTAFVLFVGFRLFDQSWLRQRLVPPVNRIVSIFHGGPNLDRAWVISAQPSDAQGHSFAGSVNLFRTCARSAGPGSKGVDPHCLARHGAGYTHLVYEPASRFWEIQGVETALFAGLALLLLAFASWRVLRTD
jgi:hypothetical protein